MEKFWIRDVLLRKLIRRVETRDFEDELPYEDMASDSELVKKFPLTLLALKKGGGAVLELVVRPQKKQKVSSLAKTTSALPKPQETQQPPKESTHEKGKAKVIRGGGTLPIEA